MQYANAMWCTNANQIAVWKKLKDETYVYSHYVEVKEEQ